MRPSAGRRGTGSVVAAMERVQRGAPRSQPSAFHGPAHASHSPSSVTTAAAGPEPRFLTPALARYAQTHRERPHLQRGVPMTLRDFIQATKAELNVPFATFPARPSAPRRQTGRGGGFGAVTDDAATPTSSSRHRIGAPERPGRELEAAVRCYNPTVHGALLQRVAARVAVADTLRMGGQLAQYMHESAAAASGSAPTATDPASLDAEPPVNTERAVVLLRRAVEVCRMRYADGAAKRPTRSPRRVSTTLWAMSASARESAGIATRLHAGGAAAGAPHRRRRQLPSCFLRYVSDVQVHEVLRSGAVVSFTHATRPEEVGLRSTSAREQEGAQVDVDAAAQTAERAKKQRRRTNIPPSFVQSLEAALALDPPVVHLHFVLHRTGVSLAVAVAEMVNAAEGLITSHDVGVNVEVADNDEHVVSQLCSVRIALASPSCAAEAALQHCLQVARCLVQVNLAAEAPSGVPRVALQLLSCSCDPCGPATPASAGGLQYAVLLRGFDQRGGPVNQIEHVALRCATALPNFFAPTHFGPASVPFFRTYHVAEALRQRRYAAAAAMLSCLHVDAAAADGPAAWLAHALRLLCSGEEREGVWQAWWRHAVPADVRDRVRDSKAELVWNVLASCRLHELAAATGGRQDVLLAAPPEPGDFVRQLHDAGGEAAVTDGTSSAVAVVQPVLDQETASRYGIHDVVVPLLLDANAAGCESVADVEAQLGFRPARGATAARLTAATLGSREVAARTRFRPLLVEATGHPLAARPWCRSFAESSGSTTAGPFASAEGSSHTLTLATDWEVAGQAAVTRDYAAGSRGPRALVWPVSKRGRPLTDRLPVGLMAAASADGSSLLSSTSAVAGRRGSRCLAMHCTLPARVPFTSFVSEFAALEDLRDA